MSIADLKDPRLGANTDDLNAADWAITGERGAVAWGAPLVLTHDRDPARRAGAPLAHPVACALDLATTSRGREALDQWDPPKGFVRVW